MDGEIRDLVRSLGGALAGKRVGNLDGDEAERAFTALLDGAGTDAQVAMLLAEMRAKGVCSDELQGCARAARRRVRFPALPENCVVLSTSRLGKRQHPPTGLAAAATAAACGVPVLVQSAPGIPGGGTTLCDLWKRTAGAPARGHEEAEQLLGEHGLALWCPATGDPGWERLLRIEDETGLRSLLDVVLKLLLPEHARVLTAARQGPVLGLAADAIAGLGHEDALIVQGVEGSVDPSVSAQTRGMRLLGGMTVPLRVIPDDFALAFAEEPPRLHEDLLESAVLTNARALLGAPGPERAVAVLGGALLLSVVHSSRPLADCLGEAVEAVESGASEARLRALGWSPG